MLEFVVTSLRRAAAAALAAVGPGCAHYVGPATLETEPPNPPAFAPAPVERVLNPVAGRDSVSVEEALARVVQGNPELRAAFERLQAADAERVQAGAWKNPVAFLDLEGVGGDRRGFAEAEVTVGLGLPLEPFGTRGLRALVAEARLAQERARYQEVRRHLAARTWLAFHGAMASRERVRIARKRVSVTRETAAAVGAQVEAGKTSPLAGIRAAVESETARAALESASADDRARKEELMALWQASGADSLVLVGELRDATAVDENEREPLAGEILSAHPGLLARRWNAERERRTERLASRERWPDFVPSAGVRWLRGTDEQDFVAGLGIEVPLVDRGGAARRAAARRADAAVHDLNARRVELLTELHTLLEELEARERALTMYSSDIVPHAQRALELARAGYEGGKFGYVDLLDAQRTVIDVEDGRAQALIAYDRALVQLESLLGRRLSSEEDEP